jgi:nucleotide-binding universal stress UspA family protein
MKNILIPIDGSRQSLEAVRAALREGAGAIGRIDLVNVQPLLNRHIARWIPKGERDSWRALRAENALREAAKMMESSPIPFRTHMAVGQVVPSIEETARVLRADEIVVGASRRGPLGRWLANSVSTHILAMSSIPVRVVPSAPAPYLERLAVPAGLGIAALLFMAAE